MGENDTRVRLISISVSDLRFVKKWMGRRNKIFIIILIQMKIACFKTVDISEANHDTKNNDLAVYVPDLVVCGKWVEDCLCKIWGKSIHSLTSYS